MTGGGARAGDRLLWRRLLRQGRPYAPHVALLLLLGLAATPLTLLQPYPLKIAIDSVIGDHPLPRFLEALVPDLLAGSKEGRLALAVVLLVGTALLVRLQGLGTWLLTTWTSQRMVLDFRARLFRHAQRVSLAYHDTKGTTDSSYRILYDAPSIQHLAIDGALPFLSSAVAFACMLLAIALLSLEIAAVALAIAPLLFLATHVYGKRLRQRWRSVKKLESASLSVVQEALAAVRVVKAFGREEREESRFEEVSNRGIRENLAVARAESVFGIVIGLTTAVGTAAVLWIGVRRVGAQAMTVGDLLLVMAYLGHMYEPLKTMSKKLAGLQGSLASAERAFELLDEAKEVAERPDARPLLRARGDVRFEGVSFSYDGGRPALEEIAFEVPAGARVGIAGHTGAGKTTLVSLLMRFYDPTSGAVRLDGADLRDWRLRDLRNQFAIVLQEPVLFSASIAENIAYARPDARPEEIVAAARAANADEFIARLPEGYETPVGERGMKLSGGERQRISLARAFLKDAPVLVLDEPTSAVDPRTEEGIFAAMERLMAGRTTFIIAHRPGTLEGCDLRLELARGRLVESRARVAEEARP
ncbi:MAG: ABC transporter ATP-binding protein/permease [Planctomycetes bacterium]|nr:ABC transporter ATP-binding protein/permease [Planctomycetota bacterium]